MGKKLMNFLSDRDVKKIREESIRILKDVGVQVKHNEAKKMLEEAGAKVDHQTDLVRIPTSLTEECIKKPPRQLLLAGRDSDKDIVVGTDNERLYNRCWSGAEGYFDLRSRKYRKVVFSDVIDWITLADFLEHTHIVTSVFYSDADLNLKATDVRCLEMLLQNTRKHVLVNCYGKKNLEYMIELGIAERGSAGELRRRPRFTIPVAPVSPLTYHGGAIDVLFLAGKYGIPLEISPMVNCGATGPVTLAGGVLLSMAEHLAGVVISQLANPGAPLLFAPRTLVFHMVSGLGLEGSVEVALISAAETQVAREGFGWVTDVYGPVSDSLLSDEQCAIEKSFNGILPALAGTDIQTGGGMMERCYTVDPVQLVIDNEINGMVARALRGIEVNDDTLGIDAIKRIGAGVQKNYLIDQHTLKYFRTEFALPKIFNYSSRVKWESAGAKDLYENAREKAISILEEYKPAPLPEAVAKELRSISEDAERKITEVTFA